MAVDGSSGNVSDGELQMKLSPPAVRPVRQGRAEGVGDPCSHDLESGCYLKCSALDASLASARTGPV